MNKILLVDDDQALSELLKEYLEAESFRCDAVFTGPDGLKQASDQAYDRNRSIKRAQKNRC